MREQKKKHGIRGLISYALAAAMVVTGIPSTLLTSAEDLSDEYLEAAVGGDELLSDGSEEIANGTAIIVDPSAADYETGASDGAGDLLSDGDGSTSIAYAPINFEKVLESGLTVKVKVPEDVFQEGTSVKAADVAEEKMESLTAKIKKDLDGQLDGEIVKVLVADISFLSTEETSILPSADVDVTLVPSEEVKAELEGLALTLVYVPAEGKAAVVAEDKIVEKSVDGIAFKTVQFPRYAIVATAAEQAEAVVEEPAADVAEEAEQVDSAKVEGVRKSYYTYFTAELSGATVTAAVPYYYVSTGTTMEVSFAETDAYESIISKANYGKELTDLKAVEISFADRRGREISLYSVNLSIELENSGADTYVLYQPYTGWFGTELYQLRTSRSPKFTVYAVTDSYVVAGLKADGIDRVSGVTKRGKTVFDLKAENASITVNAEKDAFSGSVSMEAVPAEAEAVADAVSNALGEEKVVESIQAFDISFHNNNDGSEVEPSKDVNVTIALPLDEKTEYSLVHVADDGSAEIVENAAFDAGKGEISFTADEFSIYAIVGTAIITEDEGSFEFETEEYKITVSYTKEANIPVGTELVVSQIEYDSDEYWDYWNQSFDKLNENAIRAEDSADEMGTYKSIAAADFFDISLIHNGQEFEPVVPLQVEIKLKNGGMPLFEGETAKVVHFGNDGTKKIDATELIEDVQIGEAGALGEGMPEGVELDSFTYAQTGFSVVGVFTTDEYIDFEAAEYVPSLGNANNLAATLMAVPVRAAGDPTINAGKTVTDNDGDGIYELALSVNATSSQSSQTKAQRSNVVMVIDVSGSMGNEQSWVYYDTYTYNSSTYDEYRYYSSSSNMNQRLYYRNGAWRTSNNNYGTVYNGTVYAYETRLHATQRAACAVVDALLAKNQNDDGITDMFEITVVKFANLTATGNYNGTETIIRDSTNATAIKNAINALSSGGGTNWEAALNLAKTEADYFKNTDPSRDLENPEINSVIFLTDGFPTYYVNDDGSQGGGGGENNNNISTSYTQARPSARTIVSSGYNLYNIFAFGSDTTTYNNHTGFAYLRALTNYAYGSGTTNNYNETDVTRQYAFNAKSTDDLVNAFATIINHITNNVGYAGVNLSDGVSLGATSTSIAVSGTAKAETMRYTVQDASGRISYTVKIAKNGAATFTIYNEGGSTTTLTDSEPENVTITINDESIPSQVYSVTTGSGDNTKTYKIAPATIDADTGMVKWNLAGLGILENGYTYTVAFDVWPNQLSYDICADLNNGLYANIDAALDAYGVTGATERQHIKDAIVHNADGSYSLYTNYSQEIEYYPATSHTDDEGNVTWEYGDKQNQDLPHPDPLPLKGSLLPMAKVWESELAIAELNELLWENGEVGGTSKQYQITLHVWKAETENDVINKSGQPISPSNQPYISETLGWDTANSSYIWEKDIAVAPGTMVNLEEAEELGFNITDSSKIRKFTNDEGTEFEYYVIESGHYYFVTEEGSDLHFEIDSPVYHPMIVDGTLYNVFFGSGQSVVRMDPMYAVTATNTLKGGLNISKVVSTTQINVTGDKIDNVTMPVDEDGIKTTTDEFTYEIKIWKEDDKGVKSAVYTYDDQIKDNVAVSGSIGYRVFSEPKLNEETNTIDYTQLRGAILTVNSQYADLANGNYATIDDGVTTLVLTMPANGEIRLVNLPSGTKYTVREIVEDESGYNYAATKSQIKLSDTEITEGTVSISNTVSGTIAGNKANLETYYNWLSDFYVYHSSDNTVEKISFTDSRVKGTYVNSEYVYEFSIVNETKAGYLYGGYYEAYKYANETLEVTKEKITEKAAEGNLVYTNKGTAKTKTQYNGDHTGGYWNEEYSSEGGYVGDPTIWKAADAYTPDGNKMNPKGGEVYYLKEVPQTYLLPSTFKTFHAYTGLVKEFYLMSAVDDANYREAGFVVITKDDAGENVSTDYAAKLYDQVKIEYPAPVVTPENPGPTEHMEKIDINQLAGKNAKGYISMALYGLEIGSVQSMRQYFITPDGIKVTGIKQRVVTVTDGQNSFVESADSLIQKDEITTKDYSATSKVSEAEATVPDFDKKDGIDITNPKKS